MSLEVFASRYGLEWGLTDDAADDARRESESDPSYARK
jgi:hypothetical protein